MYFLKKIELLFRKKLKFNSIGENVQIDNSNRFICSQNISIGDNIYIGFEGLFIGYGGIKIGDGTIIAHRVEIMTRNHNFDGIDLQSIPYDESYVLKPVYIKENVWIGSNVKIIPGVTIGEGAVIGMGSVITKDVPAFAVMGGNPAKVIKFRNKEKYFELKNNNQIYLLKKINNSKVGL